jgi:MFS family permease
VSYRRDPFTWAAFGALFAFGFLNALLGPALPYIRSAEGISYLVGALHQVAFAIGGGTAGALAARDRIPFGRRTVIAAGLVGAALASLAVGYGPTPLVTILAALVMGLLATLALIRVWAAVADVHGTHRAVAMTEGEVAVSLAGITTPVLIGALAASAVTWRFAFAIGMVTVALAAAGILRADVPPPRAVARERSPSARIPPTLVIIFAVVALEFALSFWLASYLNDDVGLARGAAVAMVSLLYAANLAGRLVASRLARALSAERLLAVALGAVLAGLPFLLAATGATAAIAGIAFTGAGIGALFPLTSSLHVQASGRSADTALGQTLTIAALGEIAGPLLAGAIAQATSLRVGLVVLPVLTLLAAGGLAAHRRHTRASAPGTSALRLFSGGSGPGSR